MTYRGPALDRSVPVLIVKVSPHVYDHGSLGIARSLGAAGVTVHAITEDANTPLARSRYVRRRHAWWDGDVTPERFVARMLELSAVIDRPALAVTTDDVAAVLLAEHAATLRSAFVLPTTPAATVRALSSKSAMAELCHQHGVPTPRIVRPGSHDELVSLASELRYPVIVKTADPWRTGGADAPRTTTVLMDPGQVQRHFADVADPGALLLQEYIPHEESEDWFVALYSGAQAAPLVTLSGRKLRAWPVRAGMTADGASEPNPQLTAMTESFVRAIGWQGPASLDWRLDRRTGEYNLVDFNVRLGAQFRFGETRAGVDVVRACHLDLTGRTVPSAEQDYSRRLRVGNLYLLNALDRRHERVQRPDRPMRRLRTVRAWAAADDPVPAAVMATRGAAAIALGVLRRARERRSG